MLAALIFRLSCLLLQAFKGIKGLIMATLFTFTDTSGSNPLFEQMGYPGKPVASAANH